MGLLGVRFQGELGIGDRPWDGEHLSGRAEVAISLRWRRSANGYKLLPSLRMRHLEASSAKPACGPPRVDSARIRNFSLESRNIPAQN